jgi:hypothetical protein
VCGHAIKPLNKLLNSWREIYFITKHNYLKKIHKKKIQFINAQAGGRLFQDCTK